MQPLDRIYFNFANFLGNQKTRRNIEYALKKFLIANKISIEQFISLPVHDIENSLIDYITALKKDGLSTSYMNVTFASIKHLRV